MKKNQITDLYELEVPSFLLELDQEEIDILDQYWKRRNGHSFEEVLELAEGGTSQVIDVILSEEIKKLR